MGNNNSLEAMEAQKEESPVNGENGSCTHMTNELSFYLYFVAFTMPDCAQK